MKVLIFGGTTEGRKLSAALADEGVNVTLSVATEHGKNAASNTGAEIRSDRLDTEGMVDLLKQNTFEYVIDATHPYAVLVTQNIRSACQAAGMKYLRLKRPKSSGVSQDAFPGGVTYVPNMPAAVEILNNNSDKALLAIGSKELEHFTHVKNYAERLFVRILPMQESLKKALDFGFPGSNIICMQGPFDMEMNTAILKATGAKFLVTKDSGDAGGFEAKVSAAISLECQVIVIARPVEEEGYTFDELLAHFNISKKPEQRKLFPLFMDINGKKVLVVGGGKIAERRMKVLISFGAEVTVISPEVTEFIGKIASTGTISLHKRSYTEGDIGNLSPFLVTTATDARQVNHKVMTEAKRLNIPVSVADFPEECTYYFPAVAEGGDYIAGIVSKNKNHTGVKNMAEKIRELLNS